MVFLIAMVVGCGDFQGENFAGGWREVECTPQTEEAEWVAEVAIDGPRPILAWLHYEERSEWYPGYAKIWDVDAPLVTIAGSGADTMDACRVWVAQ